MVTAIVLATVKRNEINDTAQALLQLQGVTEVYSVAGEWDLAVILRVRDNEQIAELVTTHMRKIDSIIKTMTLIGFKVYSTYDLDRMFSIGME